MNILEISRRQYKLGGYVKSCPNLCRYNNPPWWDGVLAFIIMGFMLFIPLIIAIPVILVAEFQMRGFCNICKTNKISKKEWKKLL